MDESFAKTESILRNFMDKELLSKELRVGKLCSDGKPRPIITKFSFSKEESYVLSKAPNLVEQILECLQTSQKKLLTSGNRSYHISELPGNKDARRSWCTTSCTLTVSFFEEADE